jgi:hypothetical protein|eukprot:COSAG02_NODE_3616_length_6473_cov_7.147160_1_plen_80_part_00
MLLLRVWLLSLFIAVPSSASVPGQRKLSTWVKPGTGGPMGDDLTKALSWVKVEFFAHEFSTHFCARTAAACFLLSARVL